MRTDVFGTISNNARRSVSIGGRRGNATVITADLNTDTCRRSDVGISVTARVRGSKYWSAARPLKEHCCPGVVQLDSDRLERWMLVLLLAAARKTKGLRCRPKRVFTTGDGEAAHHGHIQEDTEVLRARWKRCVQEAVDRSEPTIKLQWELIIAEDSAPSRCRFCQAVRPGTDTRVTSFDIQLPTMLDDCVALITVGQDSDLSRVVLPGDITLARAMECVKLVQQQEANRAKVAEKSVQGDQLVVARSEDA